MAIRYTFCKDERLKREQHIETLFRSGKAFSVFPVRIVWHFHPRGAEQYPARVGFSVPKKKFRHANDRNRVKRLLREAWRHAKHEVYGLVPADQQLHLFFIFTDAHLPQQQTVVKAIHKGIGKLQIAFSTEDSVPPTAS